MRPHHQLSHAATVSFVTDVVGGCSSPDVQPDPRWTSTAGWPFVKGLYAPCATVLLAMATVASPMADATPICVWLDNAGRTQYASVVPELYKAVATCTDSQKYELSPEQKKATEQAIAAREDRARARLEAANTPDPLAQSPPPIAGTAPRMVTKRPAEVVTEATECKTWWRLYDESAECFGPFRTTGGAVRVEAFGVCNVVPSPEPKCGLRRN